MFKYQIIIEWSAEEEAYVARVPALDAVAYGETPEKALRQVVIAAHGMEAPAEERSGGE
jgi:predicted RNase H-like HicB family nuclease